VRIDSLSPMLARTLLGALPKVESGFPLGRAAGTAAEVPPTPDPSTAHPTTSVAMLVTLAAADPAIERRRKAAVQAEKGVDALDRLHKELVAGAPSVERLREIAEWSQSFEVPDEPQLASIMAEIDLRVRVELAKHDIQA
jgi:hypothetical protein